MVHACHSLFRSLGHQPYERCCRICAVHGGQFGPDGQLKLQNKGSRQRKLGLCKKIEGVLEIRQVLVNDKVIGQPKIVRIWKSQKAK
jgi:hypothetical protein